MYATVAKKEVVEMDIDHTKNMIAFSQDGKSYFVTSEDFCDASKLEASLKRWVENGFGHITVETAMKAYYDACMAEKLLTPET